MKYYEIGAIVLGMVGSTVQAEPVQWSVADGGNGHWYEGFAEADEISFEEANAHAISKGGYLASVTTEGESNFIKSNVAKPIEKPSFSKTSKSNFQTSSNKFSIINLEAITAKKVAINMTELKIIKNSIIEDKITSLFVKPIILKTKF